MDGLQTLDTQRASQITTRTLNRALCAQLMLMQIWRHTKKKFLIWSRRLENVLNAEISALPTSFTTSEFAVQH